MPQRDGRRAIAALVEPANEDVKAFWEQQVCGTDAAATSSLEPGSREWFAAVENTRYEREPFVPSVARFTTWHGKRVLEIGLGAGSDHLQFARAGADLYGVDLTSAAVETTRRHLALHGLTSKLSVADAERLPFPDGFFDLVYSFGVIHHSAHPERVISEIHRVLNPGGSFIGMLYARHSMVAVKSWTRHALLRGRPFTSFRQVIADHMESPGTQSYTRQELQKMFGRFSECSIEQTATFWDRTRLPRAVGRLIPNSLGWFYIVHARL